MKAYLHIHVLCPFMGDESDDWLILAKDVDDVPESAMAVRVFTFEQWTLNGVVRYDFAESKWMLDLEMDLSNMQHPLFWSNTLRRWNKDGWLDDDGFALARDRAAAHFNLSTTRFSNAEEAIA